jgi:hypothetical protein
MWSLLRSPATAIGRGLEPFDVRIDLQTRFNWWWKSKKYLSTWLTQLLETLHFIRRTEVQISNTLLIHYKVKFLTTILPDKNKNKNNNAYICLIKEKKDKKTLLFYLSYMTYTVSKFHFFVVFPSQFCFPCLPFSSGNFSVFFLLFFTSVNKK